MVAADELVGRPGAALCRRPAHRRRGARDGHVDRRPDRGRDQEGAADRPADRAKRDQGLPRGPVARVADAARSWPTGPRRSAAISTEPHLVLQAVPAPRADTEPLGAGRRVRSRQEAARAFPGSLFDRRDAPLRGLVRLRRRRRGGRRRAAPRDPLEAERRSHPLAIGLSQPLRGPGQLPHRVRARPSTRSPPRRWSAASPASSASTTWAPTSTCCGVRRTAACATAAATRCRMLADYDRRHRSQLLPTLEEYLKRPRQHRRGRLRRCTCTPTRSASACAGSRT